MLESTIAPLRQAVALFLLASSLALAAVGSVNDTPMGWASQNGGTTGGKGGTEVTVTTMADLQKYAKMSGKYIIWVKGTMGDAGSKTTKGGSRVEVTSNKTILGMPGATIKGGFDISASNIIIRNLAIWGPGAYDIDGNDPVHIQEPEAKNIWIDHCLVSDGQDGNLDITNEANYVTVSWTKFAYTSLSTNHQYCNLIGSSKSNTADANFLRVTMVNNYWADGVVERMPRVRFGQVHVVNNLVKTTKSNYAVRAGQGANVLVEKNLYVGTKEPINIYKDETGQMVKVTSDNVFKNCTGNMKGVNESAVFTPPYTLTGLLPVANLETTLADAADGAGPTIDSWGTTSVEPTQIRSLGARLGRSGSTWTLENASSHPASVEIRSLDGRQLGASTLVSGGSMDLQAERLARFARFTTPEGSQVVTIPGL